ncbi:Na+/H+ antiporter NhaC family protein [Coprothermobacteraceae bacterium]|nr:Na+/H+ antiporter NhaC family protein [Coprothermobacteraceae bacterium]
MRGRKWLTYFVILAIVLVIPTVVLAAEEQASPNFGVWSLLPPVLAILLAFVTRQVVLSLFIGAWVGVTMLDGGNVFKAFLDTLSKYLVGALTDSFHAGILIFLMVLGSVVGIIGRMGGTKALAESIAKLAKNERLAQVAAWLLGIFVFFDDYANAVVVGPTMRPLFDKYKISREKLAFIVDATAAPITGIAIISTWIGYELSLIKDAYSELGLQVSAYSVFWSSIPYRYYELLMLLMVGLLAFMGRDFGPMWRAEYRARSTGKVLDDDARPIAANIKMEQVYKGEKTAKAYNALIPILLLIVSSLAALWYNGGGPSLPFTFEGIREAFSNADSSVAILWATVFTVIVTGVMAMSQRLLDLQDTMDAFIEGAASMVPALMILTLAWTISGVVNDLGTAHYLVGVLSETLPAYALAPLVLLVASLVSFATGTSWGTMALVMPLAIPLAYHIDPNVMLPVVGSVLAGAIFGDHCSPISDTTIMASMSSACDHIAHVKTQLPYALTIDGISLVLYFLAGLITGWWLQLALGVLAVFAVVRFIGKPLPPAEQ